MKLKLIYLGILIILFGALVSSASTMLYSVDMSNVNNTVINMPGIIYAQTVLFQVETNAAATCKYSSTKGNTFNNMENSFEVSFETVHQKTLTGLLDGVHRFYVKCKDFNGIESGEVETTFRTNSLISARIELSEDSPISSGVYEIKVTTSKIASQTPLLTYSYDGITYNPIPLSGSGVDWTGYLIVEDGPREDIGSFRFQGRDLEGNLGTEISGGSVFIVDSVKPSVLADLKAEGTSSSVRLEWFNEDDDANEYRIYKSIEQNVDYSDFYKVTNAKTFSDTSVEKGKTYYYKVGAVDKAGNEGGLSNEVYATVLLSNTTLVQSGLESRYLGLVDNLLSDIDLVLDDANSIKSNFNFKEDKEKNLFDDLKLTREIDNAKSEIDSLKREVENYKTQSLSKTELDKKLNSAQLKLSTIKRRIPDNIIISSEKTIDNQYNENDISSAILELNPGITQNLLDKTIKESIGKMSDGFNVKRVAYNVEIVYLDGTRKDASLIKETINSEIRENANLTLVEIVPNEIAGSVLDLDIKNNDYSVLKENTIVGFGVSSENLIYSLEKQIDLNEIGKIKTLILSKPIEEVKQPLFTGYFSYIDLGSGGNYFGMMIAVILVVGLAGYFFVVKKNAMISEKLVPFRRKIVEVEELIDKNNFDEAERIYGLMINNYSSLSKKEKKLIYPSISELHKRIEGGMKW